MSKYGGSYYNPSKRPSYDPSDDKNGNGKSSTSPPSYARKNSDEYNPGTWYGRKVDDIDVRVQKVRQQSDYDSGKQNPYLMDGYDPQRTLDSPGVSKEEKKKQSDKRGGTYSREDMMKQDGVFMKKHPGDPRPFMKRMWHSPPPEYTSDDPLSDERGHHELFYIQLPPLPPKLYDISTIRKPDLKTPIKYLMPDNPNSMWTHKVKPSKLIPFCPLFPRPKIWFLCVFAAVVALCTLLLVGPLYNVLADTFGNPHNVEMRIYIVELASIPIVSVVFTYFHIWLALYMLFHPIEFVGLWRCPGTNTGIGWQGIIPFKAERMARISVRNITQNLINPQEMMDKVDPKVVCEKIGPSMASITHRLVTETCEEQMPEVWAMMPERVKEELIYTVLEETPQMIEDIFSSFNHNFDKIFNLEDMIVKWLTDNPRYLVNMFVNCGYRELALIRNNGATMGFVFGMLQLIIWIWYQAIFYVPIYGMIVGAATNTIALLLIFRPINPKNILGLRVHGLFYRSQPIIAERYSQMVASEIMTADNIIDTMVRGPTADETYQVVHFRCSRALQRQAQAYMGKGIHSRLMGYQMFAETNERIRIALGNRMVACLPEMMQNAKDYMEEAMDIQNTLHTKTAELTYEQFDDLIHPIFKQDEWKLVGVGGFLGLLIGIIQILILKPEIFSGGPVSAVLPD